MLDVLDAYGFKFMNHVDNPPIELTGIGKESRYSKEYYWDNCKRTPGYLFQYTLNGSGTIRIDGKTHILKRGDGFFIQMPSNDIYYFDEEQNQAPWEFIYIIFNGESVSSYFRYITNQFGKVITLSEHHPAIRKMEELYQKARIGQVQSVFQAESEVFQFLCLLCETEGDRYEQRSLLVENAVVYLKEHLKESISLSSAAEYLGVSQEHLSREFKRQMGEQPVKYITKLRLEVAVNLLCTTNLNIEKICSLSGFSDSNYFSKVFRKYMNCSPMEFRKQMQLQGCKSVQF